VDSWNKGSAEHSVWKPNSCASAGAVNARVSDSFQDDETSKAVYRRAIIASDRRAIIGPDRRAIIGPYWYGHRYWRRVVRGYRCRNNRSGHSNGRRVVRGYRCRNHRSGHCNGSNGNRGNHRSIHHPAAKQTTALASISNHHGLHWHAIDWVLSTRLRRCGNQKSGCEDRKTEKLSRQLSHGFSLQMGAIKSYRFNVLIFRFTPRQLLKRDPD
jgi:hypothetical protein